MAKRPGAPKIDGTRFHFIAWVEAYDYAYQFYRSHGLRSISEAINKIILEHKRTRKDSDPQIAPKIAPSSNSVQ
jgi:hypothetical protein